MIVRTFLALACGLVVALLSCNTLQAIDRAEVVQSFLDHVDELSGVEAKRKAAVKEALADSGSPSADELTEALLDLYPSYEQAIEAADADDVDLAIEKLAPLAGSEDRFLAADASFYLARSLMNTERFEAALPLLEKLTDELADFSLNQSVSTYFKGVAQAGLLQNEAAIKSLLSFLESDTDAPERLRVSAWRKVQELQGIEAGKLDDIYQRMDFSRRRLEQSQTDDVTQEQQDKIVSLLGKLIKQEQKKEASSSSKNTKKPNQQDKQQQQAKSQSKPRPNPSAGKSAGSSQNANGKAIDKSYNDSPASPWSRLRDRSRDPANNAVKDKLPARYRDIVEKYYEAANGN